MLTKRQVDSFAHDPNGPAKQILWDGDLPGFGVRVFPTGAKSFVLDYRTAEGRKRLLTLGKYGVLTPHQARELARKALLEAKTGADPLEARQEARRGDTVRRALDNAPADELPSGADDLDGGLTEARREESVPHDEAILS